MENPYKILGVSPDSTDEELKKAYRELAKKYHPDNYINNPLADLASEKMKQINEAYDIVTKERAARSNGTGSSSGNNGSSYNTTYRTEAELRIRKLIDEGRISEAEVLLSRIPQNERGAEWHFLKSCVCLRKGWLMEARQNAQIAVQMNPNNQEYVALLRNISASAPNTSTRECSVCDICTALMCLDCLCGGCS